MLKRFFQTFLTGLSTLLPIALTIFIFYKIFMFIDSLFGWLFVRLIGREIVGLGFVLTIISILAIGVIAQHFIAQKLIAMFDNLITKIPIVQDIYFGIKEFSNLFTSSEFKQFSEVVAINFPNEHTTSIGFVTKKQLKIDDEDKICVFIPTTPNPGNGFLIFVDRASAKTLDISIDKALKSIVSMGTITPDLLNRRNL